MTKKETPIIIFALFTILLLAEWSIASPYANHYMDTVLATSLKSAVRMQGLDPTPLSNFSTEFTDKVTVFGKVKGKCDYYKGNLSGLSEVRRYSECQGPYYSFGMKSVNCSIVLDNLKIVYEGKLKYGKVPKVNIKGKSNVTNTILFAEISQGANSPAFLKTYRFQQVGQMKVNFTGLGLLNKYSKKVLEDGYKAHAEAQLFNILNQRYQTALNQAVNSVPLP